MNENSDYIWYLLVKIFIAFGIIELLLGLVAFFIQIFKTRFLNIKMILKKTVTYFLLFSSIFVLFPIQHILGNEILFFVIFLLSILTPILVSKEICSLVLKPRGIVSQGILIVLLSLGAMGIYISLIFLSSSKMHGDETMGLGIFELVLSIIPLIASLIINFLVLKTKKMEGKNV